MYEISSSQFNKSKKVMIDNIEMTVSAPGAGSELEFSRKQRRLEFLQKKLEAGTANEADLDRLDELEADMMNYFGNMLKDGTDDNSKVKSWLDRTPVAVIQMVFEEIKNQSEKKELEENVTTTN